jgi:ATP-binding cassette, subfamily B, bacterial CvaB/MchF/RaxB
LKPLLQSETAECALACLSMLSAAHGLQVELADLRQRFPLSMKGATLAQLIRHAETLNFIARPVRLELDELDQLKRPCILHWDLNHFVVLHKVAAKHIVIFDPAVGERRISMEEASRHFTGVALELTPGAEFKPKDERQRLALGSLTGKVLGLKRSLLQVFAVALVLELFALAAPLLNQLVVDDAIASHDADLLGVLLLGFGLLLVLQTLLGLARSWMVTTLSMSLGLQWATNVFAHLLRLPVDFFERRHLGDVSSRFGSVGAIQATLSSSLVEAALDGLMALAALGMMLLYSPKLTAVVVAAVLLYGLLRWLAYRPFRAAAAERLVVSAKEQSYFLETLRAISPLKLFGREQERRSRWQNLKIEVQNRDMRTARMNLAFSSANSFVFGLENLLVFWLGAGLILHSGGGQLAGLGTGSGAVQATSASPFTIGMLFAFISYKTQFTTRVSSLINAAVEFKMLSLHAERLADIALAEPERSEVAANDLAHLSPSIELRNVSFRYGEGEPWVLKNLNLKVEPGEHVAIVGPSGCGKSTLLKILLGLRQPQEGELLYGGIPVKHLGLQNYRAVVGAVLQDDVLLAGSVGDNISFFDLRAEPERITACARLANIHSEIAQMPMGYQTLVGDMGSALSGGQKQRVVLARCLYKTPKVLLLDEATSHLDVPGERVVVHALAKLQATRLVVAHRTETIAAAQRVLLLQGGQIHEVLPVRKVHELPERQTLAEPLAA